MTPTLAEYGLDKLSASQRLALADALRESVAREEEQEAATDGKKAEIRRRIAEIEAGRVKFVTWEESRARAEARVKR